MPLRLDRRPKTVEAHARKRSIKPVGLNPPWQIKFRYQVCFYDWGSSGAPDFCLKYDSPDAILKGYPEIKKNADTYNNTWIEVQVLEGHFIVERFQLSTIYFAQMMRGGIDQGDPLLKFLENTVHEICKLFGSDDSAVQEPEAKRVSRLSHSGLQYRVIDRHRCKVDKNKWRGRRYSRPFEKYEVAPAVDIAMEKLNDMRHEDTMERENPKVVPPGLYFEPDAKIVGVWVTGSGIAGRYTRNSDVDIWIQIDGLTNLGEKCADQDLRVWLEEHDERIHAAGEERTIDIVIVGYQPEPDACRIDFMEDEQDEIETFNCGGSEHEKLAS